MLANEEDMIEVTTFGGSEEQFVSSASKKTPEEVAESKADPQYISQERNYSTGARRDRPVGKGHFYAITPIGLKRLAQRYEFGSVKYGNPRNWEKGMPIHEFFDSAMRHLNDYCCGDTGEDHLAAAAWNIFAMMHTEELMPWLQDMPLRPEYKTFLQHQRRKKKKEENNG